MDVNILLSKAHAEFRKLRSGELGDNLRSQGIEYKIIWGLESYRLREIAERIKAEIPDTATAEALAQRLWDEDVRESKMLATRLFPIGSFTATKAQEWAEAVKYTELADQLCMNLLSRLDCAPTLAQEWLSGNEMKQYIALQLALRLELNEFKPQAEALSNNAALPMWLRATAQRLLQ